MIYMQKVITLLCVNIVLGCLSTGLYANAQLTSDFYESMLQKDNNNEALLHLFFTKMPKGGDIHHHYDGSIYAETYLEWVDKKGWKIDKCTLRIIKEEKNKTCDLLSVSQLMKDNTLYRKLLTLWSDKDYYNYTHNQPPPDSNFFNTFAFFGAVSQEYNNLGLNILKQRAIKENVSYIETMLSRPKIYSSNYFNNNILEKYNQRLRAASSQKETDSILDEIVTTYNKTKTFAISLDSYIATVKNDHANLDDENFMIRYQTFAVRVLEPVQVFTELFSGYLAANRSPLIVGVNIVAPENNHVTLKDYTLQMRMYHYLNQRYPKVNRALHAGELTLGMVRPKDLTFHIREAREIADAQRIGHGVDISYEDHSIELLKDIKKNSVVEINFSSNEFILGVKGDKHPYLIYEKYNVPLVISTDDSGVSRNNLTDEYVILATRYHPTYKRIKEYVYNSIKYSFLEKEEKQYLIKDLDKRFLSFESEMVSFYKELLH